MGSMRNFLAGWLLVAALACGGQRCLAADIPTPTVIVDVHALGAEKLDALKRTPSVIWTAEFGSELLIGVEAGAYPDWLQRERVRDGIGSLRPEELWIREHACPHVSQQPALAVIGGYEVLRQPPAAIRYALSTGAPGFALPADGVVSRELANQGGTKARMAEQPAVRAIVERVDAERWHATMSVLSSFDRNSFSPSLGQARDWILDSLGSLGLPTEVFSFQVPNGSCSVPAPPAVMAGNPIAIQWGEATPDEWVVVGAHYDSRNSGRCDGFVAAQPGANDNASGCAGVIELARVFANVPTRRTILYMCFAGEEQGLWGSRRYVESLQAAGLISRVRHMINLDMIGHAVSDALDARIETTSANQALIALYAGAAATYAPQLNLIASTSTGAYSDHWYFLSAGVPSMFTWENGATIYPHYHQATDLPGNMLRARELAGGILRMDAAVLAEVAGIGPLFGDGFEEP